MICRKPDLKGGNVCVVINVQAMLKKMKREWNVGCGYWKTNKGGLMMKEGSCYAICCFIDFSKYSMLSACIQPNKIH